MPEVLWIASNGAGLDRFDKETGEFHHYVHDRNDPDSLSHNVALCGFEDHNGAIWIGTVSGLNRLEDERGNGRFSTWRQKHGLPSEVIYGIQEDRRHRLWMSTNGGLVVFDPKTEEFHYFEARDGLQSNEFNVGAHYQSASGQMFFGGINGYNSFYPEQIVESDFKPPVVITNFLINNKELAQQRYDNESPLSGAISMTSEITLEYKHNMFTFEFAAMDFAIPSKNRYAYKLAGYNEEWIETDARNRRATYTNLPADTYTFSVRGSNSDGVWNKNPTEIRLKILPPWWRTTWFRLLLVIAAASLLMMIYRSRVAHLLEIERPRSRIAKDLHDDVGATLTNITVLADLAREGGDQQGQDKYLAQIETMSRAMVSTMSDIVWSVDSRYDKMEDLLLRMHELASQILGHLDYSFEVMGVDPRKKLVSAYRHNLFLIFKEALGNCIKHSGADHVKISFRLESDKLLLNVTDNGSGKLGEKRGNGLRNMLSRAQMLGGQLKLAEGNGLSVELMLPAP